MFRRQNIPVALNTHTHTSFSHHMKNKLSPLILASCLFHPLWVNGQAPTHFSTSSGSWYDSSRWSNGVPTISREAYIGGSTPRTATISSPGAISNDAHIGSYAGEGTVTVQNTGTLNANYLYVGSGYTGTLNVQAGGSITSYYSSIGYGFSVTGAATVTGANSLWQNIYTSVGGSGNGTLKIENGGTVNNGYGFGYIGYELSGTGAATVTGANSLWSNLSNLYVGVFGKGTLTVENGGRVTAGSVTMAYSDPATQGTINLNGTPGNRGVLETGLLFEGGGGLGGTVNFNGGILRATDHHPNFIMNFEPGDVQLLSGGAFIDTQSYNVGISTALQGAGGLTKQGTGTLTLTGTSSYNGQTIVEAGTLALTEGGKVSNFNGYINRAAGGSAVATVSGTGSLWQNSNYLVVGEYGSGTLRVENGGKVTNAAGFLGFYASGTGEATVTGTNSRWENSSGLMVGPQGQGFLRIENGGTVTSPGGTVGSQAGSLGEVTVTGAGSLWENASQLQMGDSGNGTLIIQNGGTVTNDWGHIGRTTGGVGEATVTGAGSLWQNAGLLRVGYFGNGTLKIEDGGAVTNTAGTIGELTGSMGEATVTGAGSLWQNSDSLHVGFYGKGTLTIEDGGTVTALLTGLAVSTNSQGSLYLNGTSGSRGMLETGYLYEGGDSLGGTVHFNGGILRATGNEANFIYSFEPGDVQILSNGAFIDSNDHNIGVPVALQGAGGLTKQGAGTLTLSGASTYEGSTVVETGTLALASTGSIASSEEITIQAGAVLDVTAQTGPEGWTLEGPQTLSGGGTISGLVTIAGALSPGHSAGQLTGTDAIWASGGLYDWEIQALTGTPGTDWDHFLLTGTLSLDASSTNPYLIQLSALAALDEADALGKSWVIATAEGGISGDLDALALAGDGSIFSNYTGLGSFNLSFGNEGKDLVPSYDAAISSIPEPGSAVALAALLSSSTSLHRRRKEKR